MVLDHTASSRLRTDPRTTPHWLNTTAPAIVCVLIRIRDLPIRAACQRAYLRISSPARVGLVSPSTMHRIQRTWLSAHRFSADRYPVTFKTEIGVGFQKIYARESGRALKLSGVSIMRAAISVGFPWPEKLTRTSIGPSFHRTAPSCLGSALDLWSFFDRSPSVHQANHCPNTSNNRRVPGRSLRWCFSQSCEEFRSTPRQQRSALRVCKKSRRGAVGFWTENLLQFGSQSVG